MVRTTIVYIFTGAVGDQTLSQHSEEMPPDDLVKKIEKCKESHKREKSLKGDLSAKPKAPTPDAIRSKPQISSKPYYNKVSMISLNNWISTSPRKAK